MPPALLPLLGDRVAAAVERAFGPEAEAPRPLVLPSKDPRHGDYTVSAPMALARTLRRAPAELAAELAAALDVGDLCGEPEVVAPGFVNLRLRSDWLAAHLAATVGDERVGVDRAAVPSRFAVDYSAPNVAKEMHVGHLRSTIIGSALCDIYEFLGHDTERINHIGDWGTQFGMLIVHLEDTQPGALTGETPEIGDIEGFYREANERFGTDDAFRDRARGRVVELQSGEPSARAAWEAMRQLSRRSMQEVYALLGVTGLVERGESFYQPMLADVVADLEALGLVVVDDGAKCVFVPGFTNKEGDPLPLIVEKADGGYNYATTDLAAVRHRIGEVGADVLLYVVGADQSQHLEMVFAVARAAGWVPEGVVVEHVPFGLVQGEGGKRLRTRAGGSVRLVELLGEAVDRARSFIVERAAERDEPVTDDVDRIAHAIGIGAVTYFDLSQNRQSNYVFSYDKMLSLKGNTAPYLQYAYARMHSILREAGWDAAVPGAVALDLVEAQELDLARKLVAFADVLDRVAAERAPNHLCAYLFELSQAYNQFYEHCPVLKAGEPIRTTRLALCATTAGTLRLGLGLLGIEVVDRV